MIFSSDLDLSKEAFGDQDVLTLLQSASINFQNLVSMNPQIAAHPMYKIAKVQFDAALAKLETEAYG